MKKARSLLICILIVGSFSISGCKKSAPTSPEPAAPPQTPAVEQPAAEMKKAPDFTLTDHKGQKHSLADYKGKIVVLEWFNYECPFCKYHYETKTSMVDMANEYAPKGVVWLAVNSTSHQEMQKNIDYAAAHKIPFPILDDRNGTVGRLYNAQRTPEIFLINGEGYIVYHGAADNAPVGKLLEGQTEYVNYTKKALDELLAGKEISIPTTEPYGCTVKYAQ